MPTLSELFNLDPNVERLSLLPRLRGSLPSEKSVMMPDRYMPDVIAPKILYDFIRAIKAPGRARRGEVLDEEEALNTALNMFGGGLATSGSVPIGALGMSARTAPAGTVPLREIPRSPLGFYSKVEEATLPLQNKGSGGQFLAQIQKTPGVKPEEIEVLGLDKFLQSKPTVTKQEVQDYITANKPDVQEVRLDEPQFTTENRLELESLFNIPRRERTAEQSSRVDELLAISDREIDQPVTKFSKYTIPGGENYRELLLTLPQKVEKGFMTPNGAFFSEADLADPIVRSTAEKIGLSPAFRNVGDAYRSSHYDQPNILTHLRANDRVIDGKKALFIEEIQSDWHQAGRKKGYKSQIDPNENASLVKQYDSLTAERRQIEKIVATGDDSNPITQNAIQNLNEVNAELARISDRLSEIRTAAKEGVPDAPFKKSWHELALKRAIQEAVDKGYDKLAFTTGKTQAERYDLSKQVDKVAITKTGGVWAVNAWKGGSKAITKDASTDADLANLVGKELAEKAIKQGGGEYAGLDLQVGGEGQKGFYDEILPKALQNLTKKYGTKVTKSKLDEGSEVWSMDITPQMREQIASKGQPLFATAPPLGLASQDPLEQFLGYQEAENDPLMQFLGQK